MRTGNIAALPLAAGGLLNPMLAGAAMAFSSVFVVSNCGDSAPRDKGCARRWSVMDANRRPPRTGQYVLTVRRPTATSSTLGFTHHVLNAEIVVREAELTAPGRLPNTRAAEHPWVGVDVAPKKPSLCCKLAAHTCTTTDGQSGCIGPGNEDEHQRTGADPRISGPMHAIGAHPRTARRIVIAEGVSVALGELPCWRPFPRWALLR